MGLWSPWFEGDQVILNEIICLNQHLYQRLIDLIADFWKCSSQHSARNLTGKAPLNFQPANSLMYPFVRNPQNQVRFHVIWQLWGRLFRCVFMLLERCKKMSASGPGGKVPGKDTIPIATLVRCQERSAWSALRKATRCVLEAALGLKASWTCWVRFQRWYWVIISIV